MKNIGNHLIIYLSMSMAVFILLALAIINISVWNNILINFVSFIIMIIVATTAILLMFIIDDG